VLGSRDRNTALVGIQTWHPAMLCKQAAVSKRFTQLATSSSYSCLPQIVPQPTARHNSCKSATTGMMFRAGAKAAISLPDSCKLCPSGLVLTLG